MPAESWASPAWAIYPEPDPSKKDMWRGDLPQCLSFPYSFFCVPSASELTSSLGSVRDVGLPALLRACRRSRRWTQSRGRQRDEYTDLKIIKPIRVSERPDRCNRFRSVAKSTAGPVNVRRCVPYNDR